MSGGVISRKLAHQVINRAQVIMGRIELGMIEQTAIARDLHLEKAKAEVKSLIEHLRECTARDKEK